MKHIYTKILFLGLTLFLGMGLGFGQISVSSLPQTDTQNFSTYAGSLVTTPSGWSVSPNDYEGIGTGTGSGGGFYAYHPTGNSTERSFGVLRSGGSTFFFEVEFTNNTGSTITNLDISFDYEQYRYSNSTDLNLVGTGALSGNSAVDAEDFAGISSGTNGTVSNSRAVSLNLSGLSIAEGDTYGLRWTLTNESGADNGLAVDDFSITADASSGPATPGITLGPVSGNTTEAGGMANFTVVLDVQPATDVVVNISSADTGEVTVSPAVLTFTNGNWDTSQTVTATGVDDALTDGDIDVTIDVVVDDPNSDNAYDGLSASTTVTNEDDEVQVLPIIQDFDSETDWNFTANPVTYNVSGDVWANVSSVGSITSGNPNNFWGIQDLENGNGGNSGDHTLSFDAIDISNYTNVTISFDYYTNGFDGPDDLQYQIFHNSSGSITGQGVIDLNKNTGQWVNVSVAIPDTATEAYIVLIGDQNGGSDQAGFDNIRIAGVTSSSDTTVQFVASSVTVNEGDGTVGIDLSILNEDGTNPTSVDVALTTGDAADIDSYTTQTVTFPAGSATNETLTITITDDAIDESNETLTFTLQSISGGNNAQIGTQSTFVLTIEDNDFPILSLPYSEDFSDCNAAQWTTFDEAGSNSWTCGSGEYAMNGFNGSSAPLDDIDWLISEFTIDFGSATNPEIIVRTANQFGDLINQSGEFELRYSTNYSGSGDPTLATWTALTFNPDNTSGGSGLSGYTSTTVDASSITGSAFIALVYDEVAGGISSEDWRVTSIDIVENTADNDTEIFEASPQVAASTQIAADVTTAANSFAVLGFVVEDQGTSDMLPTEITRMRFVPGPNNTADWTDHIQGLALDDISTSYTPSNVAISDTEIILDFSPAISVPDGSTNSIEFELGVYLNTTNIVDGAVLQFQIDGTSSGFNTTLTGSGLIDPFTLGNIVGNDHTIDIDASQLTFITQPSEVEISAVMTPSAQIAYTDSNGLVDTDYSGSGFDISLTTAGSFDVSATTTVEALNGISTFSNLVFDAIGAGITITATDDSTFIAGTFVSNAFDVVAVSNCALELDFETPGGYTTSITEDIDENDDYFGRIEYITDTPTPFFSGGVDGDFYFGAQDIDGLSPNTPTLPVELNINGINITGLTNLEFSIDLAEDDASDSNQDWDASDYVHIFYTIDGGTEQNLLWIESELTSGTSGRPLIDTDFNGVGDGTEITDIFQTFTVSIPSTGSSMDIRIEFNLDAGDEDIALDNIEVCGAPVASTTYTYTDDTTGWNIDPVTGSPAATTADNIEVLAGTALISGTLNGNNLTVAAATELDLDSSSVLNLAGDITNAGTIIFRSDATGSAQLEEFSGTVAAGGTITVERYIPNSNRAFRFLTTPITSAGTIFDNWQQGGLNPGDPGYEAGIGTHITGSQGTAGNIDATTGLDQTASGAPSLYTYDNALQQYDDITDTNDPTSVLERNTPYTMFIRGDRSSSLSSNTLVGPATTLRTTGNSEDLFTGTLTLNTTSAFQLADGFVEYSIVTNPYQSILDYSLTTRTNLTGNIFIYDPTFGTNGAWVTVQISTGIVTDPPPPPTTNANQFIAPGTSFLVQNNLSTTPQIIFEESDKVTSTTQTGVFSSSAMFYVNAVLYRTDELLAGDTPRDAFGLRFNDQYTTFGSLEDGDKILNDDENMAIVNNGLKYIDNQAMPGIGHSIQLETLGYTGTAYSLVFTMENVPAGMGVFINDAYLNTLTELTDGYVFDFSIDENIPESIAEDRFSIVFDNTTLGVASNSFGAGFSLYPNPSQNGNFSIKTPQLSGDVQVEIANLLGQQVLLQKLNVEGQQVNVTAENLSSGVYVVKLTQDGNSFSTKLIVE